MAIVNVNASPSANAQTSSGYVGGNANLWTPGATNVSVTLPAGNGAAWIVWQVMIPSIPSGQSFNGLALTGVNDFLVGGGGGGITRTASPVAVIKNSFAGFIDATGPAGAAVPGSGSGVTANAVLTAPGLTSTDLVNGTFYVGFAATSTGADAGLGSGLFRTSALNWTIYTGANVPNPPAGTASATLSNPVYNTNGIVAPGQFQSLFLDVIPTSSVDPFITATWNLPSPPIAIPNGTSLLFTSNGLATLNQSLGPPGAWSSSCGTIDVSANMPKGSYPLSCNIGTFPGSFSLQLSAQLVVVDAAKGSWFLEF